MDQQSIIKYCIKLSPEEIKERNQQEVQPINDRMRAHKADKVSLVQEAKDRKRYLANEWQKQCRERKRMQEVDLGLRHEDSRLKKTKSLLAADKSSIKRKEASSKKRTSKSAKDQAIRPRRASPTNWFKPELWTSIDKVAKICSFGPGDTAKQLRLQVNGDLYKSLDPSTISKWIARDEFGKSLKRWKDDVLKKVKNEGERSVKSRLGRPRALTKYPDLERAIRRDLEANCKAGIQISVPVAYALFMGYIQSLAPEMLTDGLFKCSASFLRNYMDMQLHWSWRTGTRTAQKTPDNWEILCEDAFLRIVYQVLFKNILAEAMINGDQLGVRHIPLGNKTWAPYGAKQVEVFGKEEKRQFTIMVATTCSGDILLFQFIYKGKTSQSLPSAVACAEAEKEGFVFSCGGDTHWSNLACVKEWVVKIIVPYLEKLRQEKGLASIKSLLIIDCWSVHQGKPFLLWMKVEHSQICIAFIPGGCTGKFQPNDVGIQRIVKHIFQNEATQYFIADTRRQIKQNPNAPVHFNIEIGPLRNATAKWGLAAYRHLKERPELVRQAWEKCRAKNWNLSYQCITSEAARYTLQERIEEDASFALSVSELHVDEGAVLPEDDKENTYHEVTDDCAITTDQLASALGLSNNSSHSVPQNVQHSISKDPETGDVFLSGGLDDELTDADADGETDTEAKNSDAEMDELADGNSNSNSLKVYWKKREEDDQNMEFEEANDQNITYLPSNARVYRMPGKRVWTDCDRPRGVEREDDRVNYIRITLDIVLLEANPNLQALSCSVDFTTLLQALNSKIQDPELEFTENEVMDILKRLEDEGIIYLSYLVN